MTFLEEYGTAVLDGKEVAGEKIRREYDKLLNDLAHQSGRWHFDVDLATRPIKFIETFCKQSKGALGAPIKLDLFQKAMLQAAYGFVDDESLRRYQEILDIIGRKNGKTTLLSGLSLYGETSDHEGSPEIYFIATAKDQAKKGFDEANNMRIQSPLLKKKLRKRQSDIYCEKNLGFITALASDTNHLDGLNAHYGIIDELAAIKNRDIYDLVKQSMSARSQPMLWEITTNGFVRNNIFDAQYDYAAGVIDGTIKDERFLPIIYELDNHSEWTDPECWRKANPGLGTIKSYEFLENSVNKAMQDDTYRPTVMVKDMNMKQNSSQAWLPFEVIDNPETFNIEEMRFRYGIGGMDAADSVDLNAAKMICRRRGDPKIYVAQMYWIPERKLEESKTRRNPDDAPYEIWESRGLLQICTGAKVQKSVFLDWFKEMRDKYDIYPEWIGYDPWHIDDSLLLQFQNEFGKQCMIPIRQGVATLSNPMKDLAAEFQEKNINYNNNPIDKWCIANTYTKRDINGNIQPDKGQTSTKRIDGLAALLDAYVVYEDHKDEFESMI
jgi:phage terminase large subunit-like protein